MDQRGFGRDYSKLESFYIQRWPNLSRAHTFYSLSKIIQIILFDFLFLVFFSDLTGS